jgi:hypothetical protein
VLELMVYGEKDEKHDERKTAFVVPDTTASLNT